MSDDTLVPRAPAYPGVTLSAFAEPMIRGRRVALLGDATTSLAEKLTERGARLVHVFDPDAGRVAIAVAARPGSGRAQPPIVGLWADELGVRDGAFDVVIVPDLSLFDDAEEVIKRTRRLVSTSGVVLLASPNPDATKFLLPPAAGLHKALGYYELFDAISLQFSEVKMLGQAPFVGYALVDFSEAEPEISVDTSLLDEPEVPEWYIAVGADRPVDIESFALIEIALSEVGRLALSEPITLPPLRAAGPSEEEVALSAAQTRISVLLTENEKLREQVTLAAQAERAFENTSMRAAELERDGATLKQRALDAEALREEEQKRGDALAADVARLTAELSAMRQAAQAAAALVREVRDTDTTLVLDRTLTDAKKRIADLEAQITALDPPTLRSKEMQLQRTLALENQKAALEERERTLLAANKKHELEKAGLVSRHAAAEGRANDLREQLAQVQAQLAQVQAQQAQARTQQAQAQTQLTQAQTQLTQAQQAQAQLPVHRGPSREEVAAMAALRAQAVALEEEVKQLEERLRERGREISSLTRDLRQTERVGRELLFDLERISGHAGDGGATNGGGVSSDGKEARESAERLARTEADLLAAGWQIARLERALSDAKPAEGKQRDPARDLSLALAAAQREIASLRLKGFDHAMPDTGIARAEILEQSVLVSQVEADRGLGRQS